MESRRRKSHLTNTWDGITMEGLLETNERLEETIEILREEIKELKSLIETLKKKDNERK